MYVCKELGVCRLPWFLDKHEAEKTKFAQKKKFIKGILHLEIHFFCFYPKHYLGLPKHWIQFDFLLERIDLWEFTGFWEWKKHNEHETLSSQNAPAKHPAKRSKSETSAWQWLEPSKILIYSQPFCVHEVRCWFHKLPECPVPGGGATGSRCHWQGKRRKASTFRLLVWR